MDTGQPSYPFEGLREGDQARVVLVGVPWDGTASFRAGSRFGPSAIRTAAASIESYSPDQDRDLASADISDAGDLALAPADPSRMLADTRAAADELLSRQARPLLLGGEHLLTLAAVQAAAARYPDLRVGQLDAHADLRDDYLGIRHSHATVMRRVAEVVGFRRIGQFGIRSGTREEYQLMRKNGTLRAPPVEGLRSWLAEEPDAPLYLTVDLDVFDPACLPGTGNPEAGGIDFPSFTRILRHLAGRRLVAADVTELSPELDPSGASSALAAKVVRELALVLEAAP